MPDSQKQTKAKCFIQAGTRASTEALFKNMSTRQLTRTAIMAAVLYAIFRMFADILYLELITFSLLLFALVFERREVIAAAGIFALLQLLLHGIMLWNIGYLIIFPTYALLFSLSRNWLRKHEGIIPFYCACFSFLCGQLVDLPFLLFDARVTMLYVLMGMKTSLIQAGLTFIAALFLYEPLFHVLTRIKKQVG